MIIYVVTTESFGYMTEDIHFSFKSDQHALSKAVEIASGNSEFDGDVKLDSIYEVNLRSKKIVEQELELKNGKFQLKKKVVKK